MCDSTRQEFAVALGKCIVTAVATGPMADVPHEEGERVLEAMPRVLCVYRDVIAGSDIYMVICTSRSRFVRIGVMFVLRLPARWIKT